MVHDLRTFLRWTEGLSHREAVRRIEPAQVDQLLRATFDPNALKTARRIVKPGQVFSRIHVEDIARVLEASIARPQAGQQFSQVRRDRRFVVS